MPKIVDKSITVENLGEDKYRITITEVQECNGKHMRSVVKENRFVLEQLMEQKQDLEEFLAQEAVKKLEEEDGNNKKENI